MGKTRIFFVVLVLLVAMVVCAQTPPKKKSPIDPNKHAVIINGAGGEPEYANQFEKWTTELSSVLSAIDRRWPRR